MAWRSITRANCFATFLAIPFVDLQTARRQRTYIYIEEDRFFARKGKTRHLCYTPRNSELQRVQIAIKKKCLEVLPLSDCIRGYRKGQHNINCAQLLAGLPYVAKLDVTNFHPSITPELVRRVLLSHGLSQPLCRLITQLVTYKNQIPQGAPTSNHIANLVIDFVLSQGIIDFCKRQGVVIVNYGDDTAFGGTDQKKVDECVEFAKQVFVRNCLICNSKSSNAEHIGASRRFIGTSTGRDKADLPRKNFRQYRAELRTALTAERRSPSTISVEKSQMNSFRAKIAYVERLNSRKARTLKNAFFRLRRARDDKFKNASTTRSSTCDKSGSVKTTSNTICPF